MSFRFLRKPVCTPLQGIEHSHMFIHKAATRHAIHQLFDAVEAISVQGYDEDRRVTYWNIGSELMYGYTKHEALGEKIEDLIIPEHMREFVISGHNNWVTKGIKIPASELNLRHKAGKDVSVFSNHVLFLDENKKYEMYCIDIDLAEVRKAKEQAMFKENMLEAVFEATPDLFFLIKEDGTVIDYHSGDNENFHLPPSVFLGKNIVRLLPKTVAIKLKRNIRDVINNGEVISFEYGLNLPRGKTYFEARISHLKEYKQVIIIVRDITVQHNNAEVIRRQAYFDTLTLLPNRFLALDRLSQILEEAKRDCEKTAVLFLDLDDFKKVNDSLGHEFGDKLLIEAANRLSLSVRKSDTVGRLGGDEFIILLRTLADNNNASEIAEKLLDVFREPFKIDGRELILTVSIGVSVYPDNSDSASGLLRHADAAMYQAKATGRNAYSFFTKEMNEKMLRRFEIEAQLNSALALNEFEVHYQPKFDVKTGSVVGAEALLRWQNHALGNIGPDEFIPIAEHTGLIDPIGKYVIAQALNFLKEWKNVGEQDFTIAVNLSPRQLRDRELITFIKESLSETGIKASNLEFEITEGVLMSGNSYVDAALDELKKMGVKLSMDDFGKGYSSLSYLRKYSFNIIKIDKEFITGMTLNKEDCSLVKATIAMAHSLDLLVVAEGVEMLEQLTLLDELGCDLAQGYYLSKPIPPKELIDFQHEKRLI